MCDTVDFDQFHRLYAGIRARLRKIDNLLEDAVLWSKVSDTVICDDRETYFLVVSKYQEIGHPSPSRASIFIQRIEAPLTGGDPRPVVCLEVRAIIADREVLITAQGEDEWTESLIALITPEKAYR
jgi:hypothetical protein